MRTSRGLRITTLIVVSPVLLILISLLSIFALTVYSQCQTWYLSAVSAFPQVEELSYHRHPPQTIFAPQTIARLASTALVFSYNTNPWSSSTPVQSSLPYLELSGNAAISVVEPKTVSSAKRMHLVGRLKRWIPSTLLSWCALGSLFIYISLQKLHLQQRQALKTIVKRYFQTVRGTACYGIGLCGKKAYAMISTTSRTSDTITAERQNDAAVDDTTMSAKQGLRRKKARTKAVHQLKSTRKPSMEHLLVDTRKSSPSRVPVAEAKLESPLPTMQLEPLHDLNNVNQWINVGEKKRKNKHVQQDVFPTPFHGHTEFANAPTVALIADPVHPVKSEYVVSMTVPNDGDSVTEHSMDGQPDEVDNSKDGDDQDDDADSKDDTDDKDDDATDLIGTDVESIHFDDAHLDNANLDNTDLDDIDLDNVNLDDAHLDNADLDDAGFDTVDNEDDEDYNEENDDDSVTISKTPSISDSESLKEPVDLDDVQLSDGQPKPREEPSWYSPFSTGLDLDILPRSDPLCIGPTFHRCETPFSPQKSVVPENLSSLRRPLMTDVMSWPQLAPQMSHHHTPSTTYSKPVGFCSAPKDPSGTTAAAAAASGGLRYRSWSSFQQRPESAYSLYYPSPAPIGSLPALEQRRRPTQSASLNGRRYPHPAPGPVLSVRARASTVDSFSLFNHAQRDHRLENQSAGHLRQF